LDLPLRTSNKRFNLLAGRRHQLALARLLLMLMLMLMLLMLLMLLMPLLMLLLLLLLLLLLPLLPLLPLLSLLSLLLQATASAQVQTRQRQQLAHAVWQLHQAGAPAQVQAAHL
jgi:hypothetical protein